MALALPSITVQNDHGSQVKVLFLFLLLVFIIIYLCILFISFNSSVYFSIVLLYCYATRHNHFLWD